MENIQTADLNFLNIGFILFGIIMWIFKIVKSNKEKKEQNKVANKTTESSVLTPAERAYQQKLAEYERLKQEKLSNKNDTKKHILQNYEQKNVIPSYEEESISYNNLKENTVSFSEEKKEFMKKDTFKAYHDDRKKYKNSLSKKLHKTNQLKEAFILSEVLKRKY